LGDEPLNGSKKKSKMKENFEAHSLISCIKEKMTCKNFKMWISRMWQVHEHLNDKSHAQAKQCKWLLNMEPTLD
jgi:hypothetical protein